jgi:hypothetical protein
VGGPFLKLMEGKIPMDEVTVLREVVDAHEKEDKLVDGGGKENQAVEIPPLWSKLVVNWDLDAKHVYYRMNACPTSVHCSHSSDVCELDLCPEYPTRYYKGQGLKCS